MKKLLTLLVSLVLLHGHVPHLYERCICPGGGRCAPSLPDAVTFRQARRCGNGRCNSWADACELQTGLGELFPVMRSGCRQYAHTPQPALTGLPLLLQEWRCPVRWLPRHGRPTESSATGRLMPRLSAATSGWWGTLTTTATMWSPQRDRRHSHPGWLDHHIGQCQPGANPYDRGGGMY